MKLDLEISPAAADGPVVMVDDESLDIESVARALKKSRLDREFLSFPDGPPFLAYLDQVKSGEQAYPMLVLLDINMPEMSGFTVLSTMRADPAFSQVPVVSMLTSSTHDKDREAAIDHGANAYLVKPSNYNNYVDLFNSLAD